MVERIVTALRLEFDRETGEWTLFIPEFFGRANEAERLKGMSEVLFSAVKGASKTLGVSTEQLLANLCYQNVKDKLGKEPGTGGDKDEV